jgi:hypothetical protein
LASTHLRNEHGDEGHTHRSPTKYAVANQPDTAITDRIHVIRGQKVMLDRDLAELYRAEVKAPQGAGSPEHAIVSRKISCSNSPKLE